MTLTLSRAASVRKTPLRLQLDRREVLSVKPGREGLSFEARDGRLWITQEGDSTDHVLEPGETFRAWTRGRVLVQALERPAVVVLE